MGAALIVFLGVMGLLELVLGTIAFMRFLSETREAGSDER